MMLWVLAPAEGISASLAFSFSPPPHLVLRTRMSGIVSQGTGSRSDPSLWAPSASSSSTCVRGGCSCTPQGQAPAHLLQQGPAVQPHAWHLPAPGEAPVGALKCAGHENTSHLTSSPHPHGKAAQLASCRTLGKDSSPREGH